MGKKSDIVYRGNKKESNIPQLIRYSLLKSIIVQHMSVKQAASKWHVHYSSAKDIARKARKNNNLQKIFENEKYHMATKQARWQERNEICHSSLSEDESMTYTGKSPSDLIQVVSTVGWDYLKDGQPK